MLAVFALCFCITFLLAFGDEADILSVQDTSSLAPSINIDALPLELYKTDDEGNEMQSSNPLQREDILENRRASTYCPTKNILIKILNILSNLILESSNMLKPGKLQYLLSIFKNLIQKSSTTDENHRVNNDLNNLDAQLERLNTKYNILRMNENKFQIKAPLQSEMPRPENLECQYIFNVLVGFINNAYIQVSRYCKLSGKCDVNAFPFFNFDKSAPKANPYNQNNILSHISQLKQKLLSDMGYLSSYNSNVPSFDKGNSYMDKTNQGMKQDYHLILQNYLKKLNKNNAQGLQNTYTSGNLQNSERNQGNYAKYQLSNLFTDINQQNYDLKGLDPYLQESPHVIKGTPDIKTLSNTNEKYTNILNILHSNNNVKVGSGSGQNYGYSTNLKEFSPLNGLPGAYTNQNYAKETDVLGYNQSVSDENYDYQNENMNKQQEDFIKNLFKVSDYRNYNLNIGTSKNTENDKVSNSNVDLAKFGLPQLIYSNTLPSNTQENERKQFSHIANGNIISKLHGTGDNQYYIRNPVNNNANLQAILSYYIKNNQPNAQDQANINGQPVVIPKPDMPRYLYLYNQLINQNTKGLGLKDSQDILVSNTLTSHNNYVSPNVINTNVLDNNKHENYGTQLPDSSHLLGVSNLIKLNSVPSNNRILELTYKLKRTKAVYEPLYYVKYRIPYNDFLFSLQNIVKQKPYLRNQPKQVYEELLKGSNEIEASGNLKDLNRDELVKLTFNNGTLIDAKVLENNDLKANEQLKMIQDLNANLSYANIDLNENSNNPLESVENLLNTTVSSGFDGSFQSNVYPLTDIRRLSLNGYTNSFYKTPVVYPNLNYNYNPYSKSVNPAYSTYFVSPSKYTYNPLSKNIVRNIPASYNLVNARYVG